MPFFAPVHLAGEHPRLHDAYTSLAAASDLLCRCGRRGPRKHAPVRPEPHRLSQAEKRAHAPPRSQVLYDGSHRYNTSRDTEIMSAITAPLIGSAWVMGQDGEMLRNTGASWAKFASNSPNESDATRNVTLHHEPYFVGNWAAGTAGQLLRATDAYGGGNWGTHATANRSRPLNRPHTLYSRLRSGNWAAGAGTTLARNSGAGWDVLAAHDVMYPRREPYVLYGSATREGQPAAYLGDECVGSGERGANGTGRFGGRPLQLEGDRWRSTHYKLYCGGQSRLDFRPFDTISLYIKWCSTAGCVDQQGSSPLNITFQVSTWNMASHAVQLTDYMNGPINGTWKHVTVPLAHLQTDTYDMNSVDYIQWPSMYGGVYFVDAVTLGYQGGSIPGAAPHAANTTLRGVGRSAAGEHFAVGDGGTLLQLDAFNVSWQQRALPVALAGAETDLLAVWVSSTDSYVVGASATVLRCPISGGACVAVALPESLVGTLRGVSGLESTAYVQASVRAAVVNPVPVLDVWVVGDAGLVLRYDGASWTEQVAGTSASLRGVFALSTSDVYACGDNGVLLHFDGGNWSAVASGTSSTLHSVWASGPTRVWVAGDAGTLLLCGGGASCSTVGVPTSAALYAVAGSRANDVFAVGAGGVAIFLHWSGEWRRADCTSGRACESISPHGADLFAAAAGGLCIFYGTERVGVGANGEPALELAGDLWHSPSLRLYCGGDGRRDFARHNKLVFDIRSPTSISTGLRVASSGADFATLRLSTWNQHGAEVPIRQYSEGQTIDTAWRRVEIPLVDLQCTQTCPEGTFVFDNGRRCCNTNATQDNGTIGYTSTTCQGEDAISCPFGSAIGSCCDNAGSFWMLQNVETMAIRNNSFGCGTPADGTSCHVFQLRDVTVIDDGSLPSNDRHVNETLNSAIVSTVTLRGIGRSSSDQVVAVGDGGTLLQLDAFNVSWQQRALPVALAGAETDLLAVWVSSTDSYVVGASATVLRCPISGGACVAVALPESLVGTLRGVSGLESTAYVQASVRAAVVNPVPVLDVWVVGDAGLVLRYDGASWTEQVAGTSASLRGVFALSTSDVYACGDNGVLLHFDGGNWSAVASGTSSTLHSVWASGPTRVWVAGDAGTLLLCGGGASCSTVGVPTSAALYAVAGSRANDVFAVGAGGVAIFLHWSGEWRRADCTSGRACESISPHGADLFAAAAGGSCIFFGNEIVGVGANGEPALELAGDIWHSPSLRLFCHAGPRRDLCDQSVLRFWIQRSSDGPDALYPTIALSTWNVNGPTVSVADYLETGVHVDGTWRRVTVPLVDLATPSWRLWDVEKVTWGNTSVGCGDQKASVLPRACQQFLVSGLEAVHLEGMPALCAADDALRDGLPARIPPSTTNRTIRGVARAIGGSCAAPRPMMMVECKSDAQLWACGDGGYLAHTDAASMEWVVDASPVETSLRAIVVLSPTEMWACGLGGVMLNGNGHVWVEWPVPVSSDVDLLALAALKRDQVWAVGSQGTLLFFDGVSWTARHLGTAQTLRGVSWYPGDDYLGYPLLGVVVGDGGAIYMSRDPAGGGWAAAGRSPTNLTLHSVTVPRHTDAWACGDHGVLLHFEGTDWVWVHSGTNANLYVVEAYRASAVLAAGASGTILWYHWSHKIQHAMSPTEKDLYAVANLGQCVFFGQEMLGRGQGGGHALMMSPDAWHTNALRLYCGSQYRRNLAPYDAIEFYVKALSSGLGMSTFSMHKWDQVSRTVRIADYVEGGVLDGQWRRVFVPLDDLRTDEWTLGGASTLSFGNVSSCSFGFRGSYANCQHFLVDDIRVLDLTPPYVANYSIESDHVLRLRINEPYDAHAAKDISQYRIVSQSDPTYASPQPAVDVGIFVHFEGFLPGGFSPDNVYEIFVRFNASFKNGHDCTAPRFEARTICSSLSAAAAYLLLLLACRRWPAAACPADGPHFESRRHRRTACGGYD